MTVKELIDELSKVDQTYIVQVPIDEDCVDEVKSIYVGGRKVQILPTKI